MTYAVIMEQGDTSYRASVPDLPGCIAVGNTLAEVQRLMREAIAFHLDGLTLEGVPIPDPRTRCEDAER